MHKQHHAHVESPPHHWHPLSQSWLRGLLMEAFAGTADPHDIQRLTAYYVWQRRLLAELPGDALQDWLEAAEMLNYCAEEARIPGLPDAAV